MDGWMGGEGDGEVGRKVGRWSFFGLRRMGSGKWGGLGIYSRYLGSDQSIEEKLFFEACGVDILVIF